MTIVSKLKLNHPPLGDEGGAALHTSVEAIYQKVGDSINSRFFVHENLANAASIDFDHNFITDFSNLRIDLYSYNDVTDKITLITDLTGWVIAEKVGNETTHVRVTNNTGSVQDIGIVIMLDPIKASEVIGLNGETSSNTTRIRVPHNTTAGWNALMPDTGVLGYNSETNKMIFGEGSSFKTVGGGLIVVVLDAPATSGVNLEIGKHYIVTGLTADTTLNLPAGAAESAWRVSVLNNKASGFRVTLHANGSDTIGWDSETTYTDAKIVYPDQWVEGSWRTTYWGINDSSIPLNGTFSGAIEFTGLVTASAGIKLPTSGGIAATLSHYEEYSYTGTWNISGSTTTSTLYFYRVGKIVQLTVSAISHVLAGGPSFFALNAAIPARFRPQQIQSHFLIAVKDSSANLNTPGLFYMDSDGNIGIYKNVLTDNFTNGGISGTVSATHVSYVTN